MNPPVPPRVDLPIPAGWYCLGFSEDVPSGAVVSRRLAARELVLFRDNGGVIAALDAYCPHLGAWLGAGTLEDGALRCPFHGFRFDGTGACVSTPYGGKVPTATRAGTVAVRDVNGLLMAWHGPDAEPPRFEIPAIDRAGWTAWRHHRFELRGHPQEVAENSVDVGHLAVVHQYKALRELEPLRTEGALLFARYGFERPGGLFGSAPVAAEIAISQWGLGYAIVEVSLANGVRTRQLVLALPVDDQRLHLRIGMSVRTIDAPGRLSPLLAFVPGRWLAERVADIAIREYIADVSQDVPIWESKRWLASPRLAQGDGPIGRYRAWSKQFYEASAS